jgi:hypothetical protein
VAEAILTLTFYLCEHWENKKRFCKLSEEIKAFLSIRFHECDRFMTKESDSSTWVKWSIPYDPEAITPMYYDFVYLLIPSCVAILSQSLYRHRSVFKPVRICCDTAALSGLLWGIFLLISFDKPNQTKSAILRNVFAYGIFQAIINYCDAYMFFKVQFLHTYLHKFCSISISMYMYMCIYIYKYINTYI